MRCAAAVLVVLICLSLGQIVLGEENLDSRSPAWKIAFVRDGDVWIANGDGSGQRRIIQWGVSPAWSSDKKHIAFARSNNVWIANADGTAQKQVTHFPKTSRKNSSDDEIEISWRPGTNQITFSHPDSFKISRVGSRGSETENFVSIYDVTIGKKETVRYDIFDNDASVRFSHHNAPSWNRLGNELAFVRNGDIWLAERFDDSDPAMRPGWDVTRLHAAAGYDAPTYRADRINALAGHPSWSPDGKSIVYSLGRGSTGYPDAQIYVFNLKTNEAAEVTIPSDDPLLHYSVWPSFSQDGKLIAYEAMSGDVYVVSTDGQSIKRLIRNARQPAW